jgi:AcrR family transcriptional regulator
LYKLCKSEQSARRQRELELGLLKAMKTREYEEISISELCEQMQIPRKSFYRYFSNKDGALMALLDHTLMEFEQIPDSKTESSGDLERFFAFWHEHRELLEALIRSRLAGMLVERATHHAIRERLMPGYLLNTDSRSQQLAMTFSVCGLLSMVMQWHHDGYRETPEQMAKLATMMLTRPLIPGWN